MTQQMKTIRLEKDKPDDDFPFEGADVYVAAPGKGGNSRAGRTIREALRDAGVPNPTETQVVRVNLEPVRDLSRVLQRGDTVTVTERLTGAS